MLKYVICSSEADLYVCSQYSLDGSHYSQCICVFILFQGPQFHLRCNSLCHYILHHGEPCPSLPPWPHWDPAGGSPPNAAPEWHTVSDLGPALHVLLSTCSTPTDMAHV